MHLQNFSKVLTREGCSVAIYLGIKWNHLTPLQLDPITAGYFLLTSNLFALKSEKYKTILTGKIIEWAKFIDYYGLSIEADLTRVGKKNVHLIHIGYILSP